MAPMSRDPREVLRALDPVAVFEDAYGHSAMPHQVDYLRETRPVIVLKGRQTGFSQAAAALAIHRAMFWPGSLSAIVSPSQRQSSEVATRARSGLRELGERLVQDSTSLLRLPNDSRVLSLPGSARSVRGWSVDGVLVLDEAAFLDPETFVVARATTATGGRIVVQSTPAGEGGLFHELWSDTPAGWARMRVPTAEAPTVSAEFMAQERKALPPDLFAQEYECAFGRAGRGLFSLDQLAAMASDEAPYAPLAALDERS
jgi:hypothetical protein